MGWSLERGTARKWPVYTSRLFFWGATRRTKLSNPGRGGQGEVTACKCRGGSARPRESARRGGAATPQITS